MLKWISQSSAWTSYCSFFARVRVISPSMTWAGVGVGKTWVGVAWLEACDILLGGVVISDGVGWPHTTAVPPLARARSLGCGRVRVSGIYHRGKEWGARWCPWPSPRPRRRQDFRRSSLTSVLGSCFLWKFYGNVQMPCLCFCHFCSFFWPLLLVSCNYVLL